MTYELDVISTEIAFLNEFIRKSVSYLKTNWNKDGGCPGDYPGAPSNSWSTASCVYALIITGESNSKQVTDGIRWLLDCQNSNGSFPILQEHKDQPMHEYIIPSVFAMLAFYEYSTYNPENSKIKLAFEKVLNYILESKKAKISKNEEMCSWCFQPTYLFSWEEIARNDCGRFIEFLRQKFNIDWIKSENIEYSIDCGAINVSAEKNSLSLTLNNEKTKAILTIDNVRHDEFEVKTEKGTLNIYQPTLEGSTIETAIVIRSLKQVLYYFEGKPDQFAIQKAIEGGKNWLLYAFKYNNKWGVYPEDDEKKELPTAYTILALHESGVSSKEIQQAVYFLKSKQSADGSWKDYFEYKKLTGFGLGTEEVAFYFSTPYIIEAIFLVDEKEELDKTKIEAIFWLTEVMKKGYVHYGLNSKITIWPTRDCILTAYRISSIATASWLSRIADEYRKMKLDNRELERDNKAYKESMLSLVDSRIKEKYNYTINWIAFLVLLTFILLTEIFILIFLNIIPDPSTNIPIIYTVSLAIAGIIGSIIWDKKIR